MTNRKATSGARSGNGFCQRISPFSCKLLRPITTSHRCYPKLQDKPMLPSANKRASSTCRIRIAIATAVFCLVALSAKAQSNAVVRVMAANLNGDSQTLGTPQLNILKGLKADVVAMQEFQYGDNSPTAFRSMIDATFGTNYVYFRESGYSLPNGIISRYPFRNNGTGSWDDPYVSNRGFAWAQIDLPGTNDLYIVSVHLLTSSSTTRNLEAAEIKSRVQSEFPSNAWVIVAGDMNTDSRGEAAISTFTTFLSDSPIPTDAETGGDPDTNEPRSKPYDYVLPSFAMTDTLTSVIYPSHTFPKGLVFDSRVYTPLSDVSPVQLNDSSSCQHMGIVKDFLVPTLQSGALLVVTPPSAFSSSGMTGGPFSPSTQNYTLSNGGDSNLTWSVTHSGAWVTVSPTNGILAAGTSTNVTVSINATANSLAVSSYTDSVLFTNLTNAAGTTTRSVNLTVTATFPIIVTNGYTLAAESCTSTNGVVDPNETVTVNFSLKNTGSANTSNLVATLLATSDVNSPDGPFAYGVVSTNGTPVAQAFTFTAGGTCGGVITATLQLQDGLANLGTISYIIPLGVTTGIFTQNFDSVTVPSLPAGWATSSSGAQTNWVTSAYLADTAPNAAFTHDSTSAGISDLETPSIAINSAAARLNFRQNYFLLASSVNSATGYDGGVLEIKIGGGSYTDIVAAGGSFVSGGYNRILSGLYSNSLAGRSVWSGVSGGFTSGGFTSTVVNLPASAAGQNIQFRWRCATGNFPAPVTNSGTLAFWDFDVPSASPTTVAPNLSVSEVTTNNLGSGATLTFFGGNPSAGSAIAAAGFTSSAGPPNNSFPCFSFSITVSNGAQAILSSLSFDDRASGTGPTKFSVHVSTVADFSSTIYTSGIQNAHTAFSTTPMNTSTLNLSNLTGTIYFRLYGYQASAGGGTWRIDNLNIQGTVISGGTVGGIGWYVDTVTIQDSFCCTNVTNPLVADFTGSPTIGAAPLTVTFTDASTGTVTNWLWEFGDGGNTNITTNAVDHTYAAGTYDVALVVSGPDGVSTNTKVSYITAWTPFQSWQIQYFGSTSNPAAAGNVDADGDGQDNQAEFSTGTDPTNSVSALRITSIMTQGTNMLVNWTMGSGKTNALQATNGDPNGSYNTNGFTDIVVITNTVGTVTNGVDVGGAGGPATRYYRVRLVP
jgi:PKD repeat protein/endonuclease/exonuclease/phosphatase family metal-dependent hydrolase